MDEEYVKYEEALALQELGFDEYCMGACYYEFKDKGKTYMLLNTPDSYDSYDGVKAPLYQQAFRWFRDKKLCDGSVCRHGDADGSYSYRWDILCEYGVYEHRHFKQDYKTHEEAELECLKKLIEIVKGGEK